jgi:hypothetical protein
MLGSCWVGLRDGVAAGQPHGNIAAGSRMGTQPHEKVAVDQPHESIALHQRTNAQAAWPPGAHMLVVQDMGA